MFRSFELENNHENLEEEEDNPFDYFLESTSWLPRYQKHQLHNTAGNTMPTCVWKECKYKKENRNKALSISFIKKRTRVEFLMNIRLEIKCY
jgi:hypothetical protein